MRIVFMGSASLACPSLEVILQGAADEVLLVVTQPDRPKGRRLKVLPSPVRALAQELNLRVLTPVNVNAPDSIREIGGVNPDLIVVVAYGQILGSELLAVPPQGCVNIHASLLPMYRGAAPIQWAIANGERVTGVTAMFMNERMDAGDIISQKEVSIDPEDTAGSLHDRLANEGAVALSRALEAICEGKVTRRPQIEDEATFARKIRKADGRIDWTRSAEQIYNKVRGFNPWPCCFCRLPEQRGDHGPEGRKGRKSVVGVKNEAGGTLRVLKVRVEDAADAGSTVSGEVIDVSGEGPLIATGNKAVRLLEVQPEARKPISGAAYLRGHGLSVGDVLG